MTPAVLVVEDEPLIRALAADVLEEVGFAVIEALSADDAFAILDKRSDVAVVFTDIEMPGNHNGLDLARFVSDHYPGVSIVIASGRMRPGPGEIPADALFLPKPYEPQALVDTFQKLAPTASVLVDAVVPGRTAMDDAFVIQANIMRYRDLLASCPDERQRRTIERLLGNALRQLARLPQVPVADKCPGR